MEIILKKDVENLGFTDDLVNVKNGYGRNFLIPQGIAILATVSAKKMRAETLKQRAHKEEKEINKAKELAEKLKETSVKIYAKAGEGTKLFGSVSNADINEVLSKNGFSIEKKFIKIEGRLIKRLGKYNCKIRLHREVFVELPFEVLQEAKS